MNSNAKYKYIGVGVAIVPQALTTHDKSRPLRWGYPTWGSHYMGSRGDRFIKPSPNMLFNNPAEGVTNETPTVKTHPSGWGGGHIHNIP